MLKERENQGIKDCIGKEPTNRVLPAKRYEVGLKELSKLDCHQAELLNETYKDISPDLVQLIICGQADIMARDNLSKRLRELAAISALAALGTAVPQLHFHINAGINVGLTVDKIKEIICGKKKHQVCISGQFHYGHSYRQAFPAVNVV